MNDSLKRRDISPTISPNPKKIFSNKPLRSVRPVRETSQQISREEEMEESEFISKIWGYQYKRLRQDQKIFAKKAIDDILFEARLGTLHRNAVQIHPVEILNGVEYQDDMREEYIEND
jgi:hypothetical protein